MKNKGFEVTRYEYESYFSEKLILLPKKNFRRELRITRTIRRNGSNDYNVALYLKPNMQMCFCICEHLDRVRIENASYSHDSFVWFESTSFELSAAEAQVVQQWLFPGPPLPENWSTLKGVSRPNAERTLQDFARDKFSTTTPQGLTT